MIGEKTCENVHKAIAEELKSGNALHGLFNSNHEAWAVLREECEEVADEFTLFSNARKEAMQKLWEHVKNDTATWENGGHLIDLKSAALDLLYECVQVCAMCDKWLDKLEKERGNNGKDM